MTSKIADQVEGSAATDQRREQLLVAAAELIAERGFSDTRISDVARRVGVSPALVIYYFGTKDSLLTAALRAADERFYMTCSAMLERTPALRDRLERLVRLTCVPEGDTDVPGAAWQLYFDLWAQALRHPAVAKDRLEMDARWRGIIASVVRDAIQSGEIDGVDAMEFAVTWAVLLDGLSIQVALKDDVVDPERAFSIAMAFAERDLGLAPRLPAGRRPRLTR